MATILFAAAGAAVGAGFGGTVLGLSGAVIGKAVGATLGRAVDQRIIGSGSDAVEVGKIDRFQVMGASEGAAIPKIWGRMRMPGQIIWASPFQETSRTTRTGGGKGVPSQKTTQYSYSVSLAIALGEGEILGVGRIWADGGEISPSALNMRMYVGSEHQLPDPVIEVWQGAANAPAYRGIAYVVIEALDLSAFGNRVPQFSFEVMRRAQGVSAGQVVDLQDAIRAVAVIPGTGEYALSTDKVWEDFGLGVSRSYNVNSPSGETDIQTSLKQLKQELPNCQAASLIVSWFGDDLRCASCQVQPKVESTISFGASAPWSAGGINRLEAAEVPKLGGRSVYGGTPSDESVLAAIAALKADGKSVMFYPFILMEQLEGNNRPNPYNTDGFQPVMPWRGRITLSTAPGRINSPDGSDAARSEVKVFFGSTRVEDFQIVSNTVVYTGPATWSYRRFILHYAFLCQIAGGVESFCIGSEMRGVTQIRGSNHSFPAVEELIILAADVRRILGSTVKISYAADWSEYFGHHIGNNVYFHLDPLWSDENIDFVGIDNYMPLSDWRDEQGHMDASWRSIYNLDYLKSNIAGGEGFDWYYEDPEGANRQIRAKISDGSYGEDWVFKYKDLRSWWLNEHHNRVEGVRVATPTGWRAESKPIRFTEYGCAAIDKGTNEPNKFFDGRSSESSTPRFSGGSRDDLIQMQYYRAMHLFWTDASNNPNSQVYYGKMIDWDHCYAWSWDARPYPEFPRNSQVWSDGESYYRGHWLNGRATSVPLDRVIHEICDDAGLTGLDTSFAFGAVHGYAVTSVQTGRAMLQPLATSYGFDCHERDGSVLFTARDSASVTDLKSDDFVDTAGEAISFEVTRAAPTEANANVRFSFIKADGSFSASVVEAFDPSSGFETFLDTEYPILFPADIAKTVASRWRAEASLVKNQLNFSVPLSLASIEIGSCFRIKNDVFRVDRLQLDQKISGEATHCYLSHHSGNFEAIDGELWSPHQSPGRLFHLWLDIPSLEQATDNFAPYLAATAKPWLGPAVLWSASEDADYVFNTQIEAPATIGLTQSTLLSCRSGIIDRGEELLISFDSAVLTSTTKAGLLGGKNLLAIGNGEADQWEVFQFANARLLAPGVYGVSCRLRGQLGTDAFIRDRWDIGSYVVVLDDKVRKIQLPRSLLNISQNYRLGAISEPIGSDLMSHDIVSFAGGSFRPYSICHLRGSISQDSQHRFRWTRRTRIDGDSWGVSEVSLNEEREQYQIVVRDLLDQVQVSETVTSPMFDFSANARAGAGIDGKYTLEVAQVSSVFGLGPSRKLTFGS